MTPIAATARTAGVPAGGTLADYLELTKPRVTLMVVVTTAIGFYLGSGAALDLAVLFHTLAGTALVAAGTSALNQYVERREDGLMLRTRHRPLPAGRLDPHRALLFAIGLSVIGILQLLLAVNIMTTMLAALTLLSYVFVYTPLKKVTTLSTLFGAIPGALPPLGGWTAAAGVITPGGLILFAILFFWQLPHSLAIATMYRDDYARGGFLLLPVVDRYGSSTRRQIVLQSLILLPLTLAPTVLGVSGPVYFVGALLLSLALLGFALHTALRDTVTAARRLLLASVVYLPLLLGLMAFDRIG
jgi:protoheme IX farnesyltransferase